MPSDGGECWSLTPGTINYERCVGRYRFFAAEARGRTALDCACGPGVGTRILARAGAERVVGMDLDERALAEAAVRCRCEANVEILPGDITRLPFPDATFDLVVSSETIEHVSDWRACFSEIRRVLKPDGVLCLSTPNRPVFSAFRRRSAVASHVREVSSSGLKRTLDRHFRQVEILGQDYHRSADVFYWTRRLFNAWAPMALRSLISRGKTRAVRPAAIPMESGRDEFPADDADAPSRSRVHPLDAFPGCVHTYSIARCRGVRAR